VDCLIVRFEFQGELWLYFGPDPWHFVTVPADISEAIHDQATGSRSRFGSIRVAATVGTTTWGTSLFPDKRLGALVLPVKAAVRDGEALEAGDILTVHLEVAT
jgi:hypothetical protein